MIVLGVLGTWNTDGSHSTARPVPQWFGLQCRAALTADDVP